jgi:hypothetical protein
MRLKALFCLTIALLSFGSTLLAAPTKSGRMTAKEQAVAAGAGTPGSACTHDGLVGRDTSGSQTLLCTDGHWSRLSPDQGPAAASAQNGAAAADGLTVVPDRLYVPTPKPSVDPPRPVVQSWKAKAGATARQALIEWAARDKWNIQWDAPYDFPVVADLTYSGPFEKAVADMFEAYGDPSRTDKPVRVDIYRANRTIHIYPQKGPKE